MILENRVWFFRGSPTMEVRPTTAFEIQFQVLYPDVLRRGLAHIVQTQSGYRARGQGFHFDTCRIRFPITDSHRSNPSAGETIVGQTCLSSRYRLPPSVCERNAGFRLKRFESAWSEETRIRFFSLSSGACRIEEPFPKGSQLPLFPKLRVPRLPTNSLTFQDTAHFCQRKKN